MPDRLISLLKEGGIVAFPTETVYGLGADAWNVDAVRKVFEQKGRPTDNPLIVHLSSAAQAEDLAAEVSGDARRLMEAFWPGPLTLILPKKPGVPDIVTGGLSTVALRWPNHPLAQQLIGGSGPLVAPSANRSGRPSPTRPEHVREDFGTDFPVLEGGETEIGLESTVLDLTERPYRIYRPGVIGREAIEEVVGEPVEIATEGAGRERSPGTRYTHYSPDAGVRWMKPEERPEAEDTLYLLHGRETADRAPDHLSDSLPSNIISYGDDFPRMARELYDRFRQADHLKLAVIAVEPFSESLKSSLPLATALANRIEKAITPERRINH